MLQNILSNIESLMNKDNLLSSEKISKLIQLLKYYKKDEYIYPGVIMRKLNIPMEDAYNILEHLKEHGIVEVNYELYCHDCNKFIGKVFKTYSQIPDTFYADCCGMELSGVDHSIVIYRVINDGIS